jgi:hypothetical protein
MVRQLERRWIPNHAERHTHTELVVSRLPNPDAVELKPEDDQASSAPPETTSLALREP